MSIRAFELVPAIEHPHHGDKTKQKIECIECCGKNVYIGTNDSYVIHYSTEEDASGIGRVSFSSKKVAYKQLPIKKPVIQLKTASALNRILVLCDNIISTLNQTDLEPIANGPRIKNATAFCLNDNPVKGNPFSVEVCVAHRKKQIAIYTVTEDKIIPVKDVSLPEVPVTLSMDGIHICVATISQYLIVNYETSRTQDLFPYAADHTKPLVTRITKNEFLLSAPSALGMFATSSGISQRPPLQWSDNLVAIVYTHPYILALNDEFVTVHSIIDQQQKQSLPFQGGVCLGEFDGRLFVASDRDIYALVPIAIEKQIQSLLANKRVTEALDLASNARNRFQSKEKFQKVFKRIQLQAGFIELENFNFDAASELFSNGGLDVRELITLYPRLMPATSHFTRSIPPLHEIADIHQLAKGDSNKVTQFTHFLVAYLETVKGTRIAADATVEVDTALLKLYAETNSPEIETLIASESACDVEDCQEWLHKYGCHHALALLYSLKGDKDKAVEIWTRIVSGELKDESFPGLPFLVEFLAYLSDHELLWKNIQWVMDKDEVLGVKIFTERPACESEGERLRPDVVVDFLQRYPKALTIYLEHIVLNRKIQKEKFHTHLAVLYMERVLALMAEAAASGSDVSDARAKLQRLLQESNIYRAQHILAKVKDTGLHVEKAILYGKLEEHDAALDILVHTLSDYPAAERYCRLNSEGRDIKYRQNLFHTLLAVYLQPSKQQTEMLAMPAVQLLNNNQEFFDTAKVLRLLPDGWSLSLISHFLLSSVRSSLDAAHTTQIARSMAKNNQLNVKREGIDVRSECIVLNDDRLCHVCMEPFTEPVFAHYPNGVVAHPACAKNKYVCPVTGKLFSALPKPTTEPKVK